MSSNLRRKVAIWAIPVAAFCAGTVVSRLPDLRLAPPAHAAAALTPMERLLAKEEISNKIALYGLLADGDGAGGKPRNLRQMADELMTPDVTSEIYLANGSPVKIYKGRDFVAESPPEIPPDQARQIAGRHYIVETTFDDISATAARTRTTAVYFDATKLTSGPCKQIVEGACGGKPVRTVMWVYHMTWRKTPDGWQIARNILRGDN
jgi:hypothetical protein